MRSTTTAAIAVAMFGFAGTMAHAQFDSCPNPKGGNCYEETLGITGCQDQACCEAVCDFDPACCDIEWDSVCVTTAEDLCGGGGGGGGGTTGPCEPIEAFLGDNDVDTTGSSGYNLDLTGWCDPGDYGDDLIYNTIYFSFTPDTTEDYTFSTCNQADFDTRIAVLTEACEESSVIDCLDDTDGCANFTTTLQVALEEGIEYTISVGGYSEGDLGTGILTISAGAPPTGCEKYTNNCDAPEVAAGLGDYDFDTTCAYLEGGRDVDFTGYCDPGTFGDDVHYNNYFFSFTPDETQNYTFTTCNQALYDTRLAVMGDACDSSSVIVCLDDTDGCDGFTTTISADLEAGTEYFIAVGGYAAATYGAGTLTITDEDGGGGGGGGGECDDYTNDCTSPEVITGPGDYDFDTTCALAAGDRNFDTTGVCDPGEFGDDVCYNTYYFEFTAATDGTYEFTTCNQASFDTRLVIATSCDPATTVACNDDGTDDSGAECTGYSSRIQTSLTAGTYIVGVGGYAVGTAGTGTLTVIGDAEPPAECVGDINDDGQIDGADLTILLGYWDSEGGDLNGDSATDGADLTILLGNWGECPE